MSTPPVLLSSLAPGMTGDPATVEAPPAGAVLNPPAGVQGRTDAYDDGTNPMVYGETLRADGDEAAQRPASL